MADSLNDNAIYTQYGHFGNVRRQWLTDIFYNCLLDPGNGLTRMVEILTLHNIFVQDAFAVSHHSRQGPDR